MQEQPNACPSHCPCRSSFLFAGLGARCYGGSGRRPLQEGGPGALSALDRPPPPALGPLEPPPPPAASATSPSRPPECWDHQRTCFQGL
ncbi:unnamed protein product [Rangifer tarandus platyrhynchus]|uniref:Uncharacterized protein n=1 Tax=Rangifer tarandus platyrhynchus TaxID=3082113 RepID=A0AC59Z5X9_RANTA